MTLYSFMCEIMSDAPVIVLPNSVDPSEMFEYLERGKYAKYPQTGDDIYRKPIALERFLTNNYTDDLRKKTYRVDWLFRDVASVLPIVGNSTTEEGEATYYLLVIIRSLVHGADKSILEKLDNEPLHPYIDKNYLSSFINPEFDYEDEEDDEQGEDTL